jgi:integrase
MTRSKTRYMNATITKLGEKRYRIDVHPGRRSPRVRRIVNGPMETAKRAIETIRQRQHAGRFGWPVEVTTTVAQLTQLVVDDYRSNCYKSLRSALTFQKFWTELCGTETAERITSDRLLRWAHEWVATGLSPARVNRRMAFLLRGFRLALTHQPPLVTRTPDWTKRKEAAPRTGYRTWDEFVRVRGLLPAHARIPVTIEYWFGMRDGEVLSLQWPQVTFNEAERFVEIHLHGEHTKTNEQRVAVMGGDVYEVLLAWFTESRRTFPTCPWVCHRHGQRLKSIKTSWRTACVKAGLGRFDNPEGKSVGTRKYRGALIHDFRRTGVTNMEDAGIPRKVAMAISGHKTDSVYRRYHIVKREHLIEAGKKLLAHHKERNGVQPRGHSVGTPSLPQSSVPTASIGLHDIAPVAQLDRAAVS